MDAYIQQKAETLVSAYKIESLPQDEFQLAIAVASIIVPHSIDLVGIIQPPKGWSDKTWKHMLELDYGRRLILASVLTVAELERARNANQTFLKRSDNDEFIDYLALCRSRGTAGYERYKDWRGHWERLKAAALREEKGEM